MHNHAQVNLHYCSYNCLILAIEMAIFFALSLLRDTNKMAAALLAGQLGTPTGRTLLGASIVIIGFGDIGRHLSIRLQPFGVKNITVLGRKPSLKGDTGIGYYDQYGQVADAPVLVATADIIFICCPLTRENRGMIDAAFISYLKPSCILVNVARGGLLDYPAVEQALVEGRLGGLGMDVYHTEPFTISDSIFKLPNVIATPHVAGVTEVSYRTMARILGENVKRVRDATVGAIEGVVNR